MTPFLFHSAGSIWMGRGALASLGDWLRSQFQAERVFVVADRNLEAAGIVARVQETLQAATIRTEWFLECIPEPPLGTILAATGVAKTWDPQVVIGLGGGSNLDTAKLVALLLTHAGTLADYAGDSRVPGPVRPIVAIPTTAGTGSEVSPAAVFTDTEAAIKRSCLSPFLRPALALVDPALMDRCPQRVTADSGIDALTHAIEAFTACPQAEFLLRSGEPTVYQGKNPLADLCALECVRLVKTHLEIAVKDPHSTAARDGMALAATLGGLAFSNAGVALTHAMEYPVGGAVHVSHGAGNGLLLPHVMRYNAAVCAETMGRLGPALGVESTADAVILEVSRLSRAVGIPQQLRDLGVQRQLLPSFAEKAFQIRRLMRVNPRLPQSSQELYQIYEAAY